MPGYLDLHCHFIPAIDDGARSLDETREILAGLANIGFSQVVATPHMRPGMFDNQREGLIAAFNHTQHALRNTPGLPALALSSEHYFDEIVFQRLLNGQALYYPGARAVLLEFYEIGFPPMIEARLLEVHAAGLLPVIAHPERYQALWRHPEALERLVDQGIATLLDIAALAGKYGRMPQRCAETLLERGLYHAACSDAHRPSDITSVARGIERVEQLYGQDEIEFLLRIGPEALLQGELPE